MARLQKSQWDGDVTEKELERYAHFVDTKKITLIFSLSIVLFALGFILPIRLTQQVENKDCHLYRHDLSG
jgi:hypothetical protein